MKRIFEKIRAYFSKTPAQPKVYSQPIPEIKETREEAQTRQYKQYRKAMRKRGETPRSYKTWLTRKHPLHSAHRGTFSPIASLPVLYRKNKNTVLRIA